MSQVDRPGASEGWTFKKHLSHYCFIRDMSGQKERVREAYEQMATIHRNERSDDPAEAALLAEFRERCDDGARVLDAGCGQGTPVANRLTPEYEVVGLDFSAEMLRLAADAASEATLLRGDMIDLAFGADAFDAIAAFHSIIHVPVDEHRDVIEEFARVLRPGGLLLVSTGPDEWTGSNADWLDSGVEMEWSFPGADATRGLLAETGFAVLDRWVVTGGADHEGDGEVLDPETTDEPGMHFFLARLEGRRTNRGEQ